MYFLNVQDLNCFNALITQGFTFGTTLFIIATSIDTNMQFFYEMTPLKQIINFLVRQMVCLLFILFK